LKKIITIIGARPQIIKASALSRAIRERFSDSINEIIVHTGQHYDENMSAVFFDEMGIPQPDYNLAVGSGNHGQQTAKMMDGLEEIYVTEKPDAVVIYGDTNSTLAGALASAKLHIPVVHIEAGLRSFNKRMPEEVNRITADHVSTLLFSPTKTGIDNLKREGFNVDRQGKADINNPFIYHCGDIMFDNSIYFSSVSDERSKIIEELGLQDTPYILSTVHRDSNTDVNENMDAIFSALIEISDKSTKRVVLPMHPRTKNKLESHLSEEIRKTLIESENIIIIPPAGFLDIIALEKNAELIITDSGGLQKEAYFFKKPCIILRPQTEWVEIVENGNAILAHANKERILQAFEDLINKDDYTYPPFYGDADAAGFICDCIVNEL
jgi:UDP-GlcNAc3NAcA epimerase